MLKKTFRKKVVPIKNNSMKIEKDGIYFEQYDFPGVTVYPKGFIKYEEISEFIENIMPPIIRTRYDDIIFVSSTIKEELKESLIKNGVKVVKRNDLWSLILEEFLDTEFTEKDRELCYKILEENEVERIECDSIRKNIKDMMLSYNFESGLWDWTYLGLYDLLSAANGILVNKKYKLKDKEFISFYKEAVKLALKGKIYE